VKALHAIIMAGGKGTRLRPLTDKKPKALVKLAGYSILEIIIRQLTAQGFTRVTLCVGHLGAMIKSEFDDGGRFGLSIDYCWDVTPRGTAGPLRLVPDWTAPALVINCDVLTAIDFGALYQVHEESDTLLTVAARRHHVDIELGVLDIDESGRITAIREKPQIPVDVAAGIYVAEPVVRDYVPADRPMDMPGLIGALGASKRNVRACALTGACHDMGTPAGYRAALNSFLADSQSYLRGQCAASAVAGGAAGGGPAANSPAHAA
jgi:NDP-sugar pyrophosphorylase family protein